MNKFFFCFFQLFIFSFILHNPIELESATFHAILIGDSDDQELKKVVVRDLTHMKEHLKEVYLSLDEVNSYSQNIYLGKQVNSTVLDQLASLKIKEEDIVFFYYSGHGFNTKRNKAEKWPYLYFNHGDIGINSRSIVEILLNYQPRLIICFFDCCNNVLKHKDIPMLFQLGHAQQKKLRIKPANVRKLFQETKGLVLISSASPDFYSEGTDQNGSFFTNQYIEIFKKNMSSENPSSWDDLLSKTCTILWKRQRPFYELMLY